MVVFGQKWLYSCKTGSIRAKVVVLGNMVVIVQTRLVSEKSDCIWESVGIWAIVLVLGQSGCIGAKVVVFGQKRLYSGKSGCIRAKVVVFGKDGCIGAKVVVFGQN